MRFIYCQYIFQLSDNFLLNSSMRDKVDVLFHISPENQVAGAYAGRPVCSIAKLAATDPIMAGSLESFVSSQPTVNAPRNALPAPVASFNRDD
jgi:hypothetical protein